MKMYVYHPKLTESQKKVFSFIFQPNFCGLNFVGLRYDLDVRMTEIVWRTAPKPVAAMMDIHARDAPQTILYVHSKSDVIRKDDIPFKANYPFNAEYQLTSLFGWQFCCF